MQYKFEVLIDTDEATGEELERALDDALQVLDLPNGDTLEVVSKQVFLVLPNDVFSGASSDASARKHGYTSENGK